MVYQTKRRGGRECGPYAYYQYHVGGERVLVYLGRKGAESQARLAAARRRHADALREAAEARILASEEAMAA